MSQSLEQAQDRNEVETLDRALATQQDKLMEMAAPSLAALHQKLLILFEGDVAKPDRDGWEKRQLLDDLASLIAAQSRITGMLHPVQIRA